MALHYNSQIYCTVTVIRIYVTYLNNQESYRLIDRPCPEECALLRVSKDGHKFTNPIACECLLVRPRAPIRPVQGSDNSRQQTDNDVQSPGRSTGLRVACIPQLALYSVSLDSEDLSFAPPETESRRATAPSIAGRFTARPRRRCLNLQDFRRTIVPAFHVLTGHRGALPHFLSRWVIQRHPMTRRK